MTLQDNQATPTHVDYTWSATYDSAGRRIKTLYEPQGTAPQETKTWYDPSVEFLEVIVEHDGQRDWKIHGNDLDSGSFGVHQGIGGLEAIISEASLEITTLYDNSFGHVLAYSKGIDPEVNWHKVQLSGYGPLPEFETKPLEVTGSLEQSILWQSKCVDPTGLYAMGARHYDSLSGRFINADPLGHSATPDLYSYALGDPINFFDPTGRMGTGIYKQQNQTIIADGPARSSAELAARQNQLADAGMYSNKQGANTVGGAGYNEYSAWLNTYDGKQHTQEIVNDIGYHVGFSIAGPIAGKVAGPLFKAAKPYLDNAGKWLASGLDDGLKYLRLK